jgi:GntR family transcriptional repressor for pyruvate dehydrogenase complex
MKAMFSPIKSESVSDKVVDQILRLIESDKLKVGDRLPSERQLAEELEVSRVPIREALSVLKAMGIIEVRPGVGALVTLDASFAFPDIIWMRWLSVHQAQVISVLEVREAIDAKAASLAAERATQENIEELEKSIQEMETEVITEDFEELERIDRRFHKYIASISGNALLVRFQAMLDRIITLDRRATFRLPGRPQESLDEHRVIVGCIASRYSDGAAKMASEHVRSVIGLVKQMQLDVSEDDR